MRPPLVSIVLPVYNGGEYLAESIESCLYQTHREIELVIVNDASTDNTAQTIASYNYPRVKVIHNRINQGLPRSLNIGFAHAKGEYLAWTSADNLYAPNAIESLLSEISSSSDVGLVYGNFHLIDENGVVINRKECPPPVYLPKVNAVGAYFLYRRKVMEVVGDYDPDLRLAEDYDYWLRIHNRFKIRQVEADGYYYRVHSESLTGTSREAEIARVTTLAQRKNRSLKNCLKCGIYSATDPLAAKLASTRIGGFLRGMLSNRWRGLAGR